MSVTKPPTRLLPALLLASLMLSPPGVLAAQQGTALPEGGGDGARLISIRDSDQVRGLWVTRWEYTSPEGIASIMSRAASLGLTDIFFQVRGRADAFYRSSLEPWGEELTGRLGGDPGWDPLEVAITEAHTRGLRLHAWVNTFPIWNGFRPPPESVPRHVFLDHPDWIMADRAGRTLRLGNRFGYVSASPGNPEVQDHVTAVVLDIVGRYPVDGIHFDYIRLPDHDYSYDAVSRGRYLRESRDQSYAQWQADEITGMLRRIAADARSLRPGLLLTAAIVNHYYRAVGIFAQDPVAWTADGSLDYVIAMAYTPDPVEFAGMVAGHREMLPADRVAAGINLDEMPGAPALAALEVQRALTLQTRGHVFFSLQSFNRLVRELGADGPASSGDLYAALEGVQGRPFVVAAHQTAAPPGDEAVSGETPPGMERRLLQALAAIAVAVVLLIP